MSLPAADPLVSVGVLAAGQNQIQGTKVRRDLLDAMSSEAVTGNESNH